MNRDIRQAVREQGVGTAALMPDAAVSDPSSYLMHLFEQALAGGDYKLDVYRLKPYSVRELEGQPRVSLSTGNFFNANQRGSQDSRSPGKYIGKARKQGKCFRCDDSIIGEETIIVDFHIGDCEANIPQVNRLAWDARTRLYRDRPLAQYHVILQDSQIRDAGRSEVPYIVRSDSYLLDYSWHPDQPYEATPL